jgi:RHS repeat-associated protein
VRTFGYDAATAHYLPGGDRGLDSDYDRFGNREALTVTDGAEVLSHTFTYDLLDRLDPATFPGTQTLGFDYFANDDLQTLTHGNDVTTAYSYEPHGPIDTITVTGPGGQLHRLEYAYDAVLNVDTLDEEHEMPGAVFPYDYDYDGISRLTSASYPTDLNLPASETFPYDAAGNRDDDPAKAKPWEYDANNRTLSSPSPQGPDTDYTFDADGNLATRDAPGASQTFTFDRTNRLRRVEEGASTLAEYLYDPFGRRIAKTESGGITWFLWDGDQLLGEYDGSGARTRRYAYAGGFAPLQVADPAGGGGETIYDVHTDHLDTPRLLTDSAGAPVWRAAYEAFGKVALEAGNSVTFNVRFPGQYFDAETELHYNRMRYLDPSIGRYVSADPIGQAAGINLFHYAFNRPVSFADPRGEVAFLAQPLFLFGAFAVMATAAAAWAQYCSHAGCAQALDDFARAAADAFGAMCMTSSKGDDDPPPPPPPSGDGPADARTGIPAPDVPPYNDDPAAPPAEGYEWRGQPGSTPGSPDGSWFNPKTGLQVRPDRQSPHGPHNDIQTKPNNARGGRGWRQLPNNSVEPK